MNKRLLGKLRVRGFYLYPGVPNMTAVSQEPEISFGYFKSLFCENLSQLRDDMLEK